MNGGGGCNDDSDGDGDDDGGCSINVSRMYPLRKTELHRETERNGWASVQQRQREEIHTNVHIT